MSASPGHVIEHRPFDALFDALSHHNYRLRRRDDEAVFVFEDARGLAWAMRGHAS